MRSANSIGSPLLLTGVLALLYLGSLRHTRPWQVATLSIKTTQRQTIWPFSSLITPLLMKPHRSRAIFHGSSGFRNNEHTRSRFSFFVFGHWEFHCCPHQLRMIYCQSFVVKQTKALLFWTIRKQSTQREERFVTTCCRNECGHILSQCSCLSKRTICTAFMLEWNSLTIQKMPQGYPLASIWEVCQFFDMEDNTPELPSLTISEP